MDAARTGLSSLRRVSRALPEPSASELSEIQYAATLTAKILVCQVLMKADRLSMYATLFDRPEMINDILPRYLSTTAEEIQAVCRASLCQVVVGVISGRNSQFEAIAS